MRTIRLTAATLLASLSLAAAPSTAQAADPNSAAIAVNDHYTVTEGETLTVAAPGVLGNDSDPDGDPLHVGGVNQQFSHAAAVTGGILADGSFTYTPEAGFLGDDTAIYKAYDEEPFPSAEATITITVEPAAVANTPPVAVADHYTVTEGETLTIPAPGLLANDSDADADTIHVGYDPTSFPHATSFDFGVDGSLTYTPEAGFTGDDTGSYRAYDDGLAFSADTAVTITVEPRSVDPVDSPVDDGDTSEPVAVSDSDASGALPNVGASVPPWAPVTAVLLLVAGILTRRQTWRVQR